MDQKKKRGNVRRAGTLLSTTVSTPPPTQLNVNKVKKDWIFDDGGEPAGDGSLTPQSDKSGMESWSHELVKILVASTLAWPGMNLYAAVSAVSNMLDLIRAQSVILQLQKLPNNDLANDKPEKQRS